MEENVEQYRRKDEVKYSQEDGRRGLRVLGGGGKTKPVLYIDKNKAIIS